MRGALLVALDNGLVGKGKIGFGDAPRLAKRDAVLPVKKAPFRFGGARRCQRRNRPFQMTLTTGGDERPAKVKLDQRALRAVGQRGLIGGCGLDRTCHGEQDVAAEFVEEGVLRIGSCQPVHPRQRLAKVPSSERGDGCHIAFHHRVRRHVACPQKNALRGLGPGGDLGNDPGIDGVGLVRKRGVCMA